MKVFGVAKTVIDCFRFRNKVGLDVALAVLRQAVRARRVTPAELAALGQSQRVGAAFGPYLESVS